MSADKVVRSANGERAPMRWDAPRPKRRRCRLPVEVDAKQVGEFFMLANSNFERSWNFWLVHLAEEVYRWDLRPGISGHSNPKACPDGFPRNVPQPEHEHLWVEGLDCDCALPLDDGPRTDHEGVLGEFCRRANIRFGMAYVHPTPEFRFPV